LSAAEQIEKSRPAEAAKLYRQVVELGQRMERRGWGRWERYYAAWMQLEAYKPLRALGTAAGDVAGLDREIERLKLLQREVRGGPSSQAQNAALRWNGLATQVSFVVGMFAALLGTLSGTVWLWQGRSGKAHVRGLFAGAGVLAILALCTASLVFYACYKPYAELVDYYLSAPETVREVDLQETLAGLWSLPLQMWQLWWSRSLQVYFWYALIAVAGMVLISLLVRNTRRLVARAG